MNDEISVHYFLTIKKVFGQLLAAGVMRAMLDRTDEWSYRIPFAIQYGFLS